MTSALSTEILSDITVFLKYAKFLPEKGRRETFKEVAIRNMNMHIKKFKHIPGMEKKIRAIYKNFVFTKKVLPSMRSMQFGGKPIEISPNRLFNCCYLPMDDPAAFSETMFLLLGGSGVGFSVQQHHIDKLPEIRKPLKNRRYLVADSIEGWSDAIKILMRAYFEGRPAPRFDYSDIREKGSPLVTSGGKAPGPQPLKDCIHNLQKILNNKRDGEKLTSLEVHDIICFIADAVLSGGIRRAACISLFDIDDQDMLSCKFGRWWEQNPQRARANNSAVVLRHKVKKKDFTELWEKIRLSGSGEPGIYFTNNMEYGVNPCCEIALKPLQPCNLCEINLSTVEDQEDLNARARAASFIATLQASYTDFHYLRDEWQRQAEKDALLGVSGTGIASKMYEACDIEQAALQVVEENRRVADTIGIRWASRTTCIKPSGTTSLVLGTSSGIHAWFDRWYIRRIRIGKNESLYTYLAKKHPELVEDEYFKPHLDAVINIPIEAPANAIYSSQETPIQLLERIKFFHEKWILPGHIKGDNSHNVSATVYVKETEWEEVYDWMWENRDVYNGISVFPFDTG